MMTAKNLPDFDVLTGEETSRSYPAFGKTPTHTIDLQNLVDELNASVVLDFSNIHQTSFGKLLESIPIPVLLIDESCKITYVNRAWQKISLDFQRILGRSFSSIFSKRSAAQAVNSIVEKAFRTRRPLVASTVLEVEKNRIYGRVHFRSLRMAGDRALMILVEDLTAEKKQLILTQKHKEALLKAHEELERRVEERTSELKCTNEDLLREIGFRKEAEHGLQASRASFTSIVEKTSEGILIINSKNLVRYANPAAISLLGRSKDKLIGQCLGLTALPGQIREIEENGVNGEPRILEIRVQSTDWNEKPARLLMLRDITERKRAEEEMLKTEKLQSLELVAGGIAHDFNNLLTGTIANISLAKMRASPGSTLYEALRNAEKAAAGAKHLTQQLLTFTRGGDPVKKPASLSVLLKDSIALALSGSSIKEEVSVPDALWPAEIDQQQVGQVFQNLFINALQAMPNGGTLTVHAENLHHVPGALGRPLLLRDGKYVKISIKDTGSGIPPAHLTKIFDPYFTTKPKGSGIGLATAYSVIKRHGGVIDVESEVDVGTSFFIYLPALSAECEIENPVDDSDEIPTLGTGRVLLMDDEETIRMVARDLLILLGYEVETAKDGMECIEMYKAAMESGKLFSVVIMDLTVPGGMGGQVAIRKLLEMDPEVKAIVSSGYSTDPIMSNYRRYGFKGIVPKPYNAVELSRALQKLTTDKGGGDTTSATGCRA